MSSDVIGHRAVPADGLTLRWAAGDNAEHLTLRWENEGWTASGRIEADHVEYVLRLTAQWQVSQFLLFRDLDEPDLWLGTDGNGRWGEVGGGHRTDLDGATDIALAGTSFVHAVPIRRLPLRVGQGADLSVLRVDTESLGVVPVPVRYERLADRRWRHEYDGEVAEFEVDEYGVPLDVGDHTRRSV